MALWFSIAAASEVNVTLQNSLARAGITRDNKQSPKIGKRMSIGCSVTLKTYIRLYFLSTELT